MTVPFAVVLILVALAQVDRRIDLAARGLGASVPQRGVQGHPAQHPFRRPRRRAAGLRAVLGGDRRHAVHHQRQRHHPAAADVDGRARQHRPGGRRPFGRADRPHHARRCSPAWRCSATSPPEAKRQTMDEVFGRRDMIAPARLKALSVKSDARGFVQLGSHLAALVAVGRRAMADLGHLVAVPVFIAHGTLINFLYAGQHEISHCDGVPHQEAQRVLRPAVRLRPALSRATSTRSSISRITATRRIGSGDGELVARPLHAGLLPALGARADLLVHARRAASCASPSAS